MPEQQTTGGRRRFRTVPGESIGSEPQLSSWDNDELVNEIVRLRSIVGWDERTFQEQRIELLAAREHTIGLSAEVGELRALTAELRPDRPMAEIHMKKLQKRLEDTIEWANGVQEHAERVEQWAKDVEAHAQAVQSWAADLEGQVIPASDHQTVVAKAEAYDRILGLPGAHLARRAVRVIRRLRLGSSR